MADEITISCSMKLSNGELKDNRSAVNVKATQSAQASLGGVQAIGTTEEAIAVGDLAAPGWAYIRNLGPTNYVEIGLMPDATFYPMIKLAAGDAPCLIKIASGVTLYAKAHTAGVKIDKLILDA